MRAATDLVLNATAAGFVVLAAAIVLDWLRNQEPARGWLALSLGCLGLVALGGRIQTLIGFTSPVTTALTVVAFMASGFFVLLFRDSFIPVRRWVLLAAAGLTLVVTAVGVTALILAERTTASVLGLLLVGTWVALVGEPIARFWQASRGRPRVQRARMRALSLAFAVLIGILVASAVGGSALQSPIAVIVTQVVALAMVPVFYFSVSPPQWLRQLWRSKEESELRGAIQDLLIFSVDRPSMAEKAVGWASRLVGADGAFLVNPAGEPWALAGVEAEQVAAIVARGRGHSGGLLLRLGEDGSHAAMVVPLPLEEGTAFLGVLSGPFTPLFGTDELLRLEAYAVSLTAGLERVRVTERVAAMERAKSQFLNLASHELRGPITVLRGYLSMLQAGLLGVLNADGERAAEIMVGKATEMNSLVEQMLETARLEEGRLALRLQSTDLREVVHRAAEALRPLADQRHPIVLDLGTRPVLAEIDAERVATIVTNLIDNAIKYSPGGGSVEVTLLADPTSAEVRVTDHGVGISEHDVASLFTRFGRIQNPATEHIPGTGLGLYLSRELARLHGGEISVSSRPAQGSAFTLTIPRQGSQAPVGDRVPRGAPA